MSNNILENLIRTGLHEVTQGQVPSQDGGVLPEGRPFYLTGALVIQLHNDRDHIKAYIQVSAPTIDECVKKMERAVVQLTAVEERLKPQAETEKSPLVVLPPSRN